MGAMIILVKSIFYGILVSFQAVIYYGYLLRYINVLKGRDQCDYWTLCLYWHGVFAFWQLSRTWRDDFWKLQPPQQGAKDHGPHGLFKPWVFFEVNGIDSRVKDTKHQLQKAN